MQETDTSGLQYVEYALIKLDRTGNVIWDSRFDSRDMAAIILPNWFFSTTEGGFVTCFLKDTLLFIGTQQMHKRIPVLVKFDEDGKIFRKINMEGIGTVAPTRVYAGANGSFNLIGISLRHVSGFSFIPTSYFIQLDASGKLTSKYLLGETFLALNAFKTGSNKFVIGGSIKEEGRKGEGTQKNEGFFVMEIITKPRSGAGPQACD